jgi:hypothetical protein
MDRNEELRIYMKAARAKFDDIGGRHLSEGEMIALCQERMAAAEREVARPHIIQCDHCLQLYKDVNDFFEPLREDEVEVGELQVHRAWKGFWRQAQDIKKATDVATQPSRSGFLRPTLAMAAGLLLALTLTGVWAVRLRQEREMLTQRLQSERQEAAANLARYEQERVEKEKLTARLAEMQQPQLNTPIYDLLPQSVFRGQGRRHGGDKIVIPAAARNFTLLLNVENPEPCSGCVIEIIDQRGNTVWREKGIKPNEAGSFVITLPRSYLVEGRYRLKIYSEGGAKRRSIGEYAVTLGLSR